LGTINSDFKRKKRNNPAKHPDYYLAYLDRQRKKIGFNTAWICLWLVLLRAWKIAQI